MMIDEALSTTLRLGLAESDVAIVAELLVGKSRGDRWSGARLPTSTPKLELAVARVVSVGCLRFLLASGGHKPRTVLRDVEGSSRKKRVRGRLWDPDVNAGFSPTFSALPWQLVWSAATTVLPLVEERQETLQKSALVDLTREEKKALAKAKPAEKAQQPLDHVFCVLALENRAALRMPDVVENVWRAWLLEASPLAALFVADEGAANGDSVDVDALCAPDLVRLLEVLDDALASAFSRRLRLLWTRSADGEDFARRCGVFSRNVQAFLRALDEAQRLDLIGPVARLVASIPDEVPKDARTRLVRLAGVQTMADRDRVIRALQSIVDLALALDDIRARMQAERYGDDRYEEAQLALGVLDEILAPRRDAVGAFARALSGAVG